MLKTEHSYSMHDAARKVGNTQESYRVGIHELDSTANDIGSPRRDEEDKSSWV